MKRIFCQLIFLFLLLHAHAQVGFPFRWVAGSDTINQTGNYGNLGTASSSSIPGARQNSQSWTDNSGKLWLFGGHGYSSVNAQNYLNDLWRFDTLTKQWTWIAGSNLHNQTGIYGTLGTSSSSNIPGARQNAFTWKDNSGNLWLFGGFGRAVGGANGYLNDLWKYNVTTNEWTWMSGSNSINATGSYGTKGVASAGNVPPARYGGVCWSVNDELWLFGGQGTNGAQTRMNDLWRYKISTGQWTWMSGSNLVDQNGVYGTKGVESAGSVPGGRQASVAWKDNAGNFWFFGGYGFPASGSHDYLNDLWKYNPTTNQWTWISGSNATNQPAVYGTKGVYSVNNAPGARQMCVAWTDNAGDFYMFGAWGYVGPGFGRLNDLWKYNVSSNQWMWAAGSNTVNGQGVYGTKGVASVNNLPGARRMSVAWKDNAGDFWFFGGNGYDKRDSLGLLNDLWHIKISAVTGMTEQTIREKDWQLFPIPFAEKLTIVAEKEMKFQLMNISGQVLSEMTIQGKTDLNTKDLPPGVYFVRCNETTRRVIKTE